MKKVFVDSDVVLSSLLSSNGAANFLLNEANLELFSSNISLIEIKRGIVKLSLDKNQLKSLIANRLKLIDLRDSAKKIKETFSNYVFDEDDTHILAGAVGAKVNFLITYNIKDFRIEKIKKDMGIVILTPGNFLQYLRSME